MRFPSWSLIPPPEDPSTLFIVAGMQPLKPYFSGQKEPPAPRFTTVQKVLRAGGKDSDLEEVGLTARHASMFEMLGNFSFGDYFKDGAIDFAWEFVTEHMGLDPDRIWPTVFAGDPELGLGEDDEAVRGWLRKGVPRERIVGLPRSENFWGPAGATGPCGPCSELNYDRGEELRLRRAGLRAGLRSLRAVPRVLEPRLHGVRPRCRGQADAAAEPERRHGPRARAWRHAAAGGRLDLRHGRVPADHGLDRGGVGGRLRLDAGRDQGAPRAQRPRARDDVPDRRGRRARPTRAAATSSAG